MYEIFERLLQEKGLKAADVSRATGIKSPVFSEWKKGKSKPNTEKMIKIAKFLDVSVEYLMTGKEPNAGLYSDENADLLIEITHKIKNDSAFADRLARYMSLLSENKKSVDDMIDLMYSKEHKEEASPASFSIALIYLYQKRSFSVFSILAKIAINRFRYSSFVISAGYSTASLPSNVTTLSRPHIPKLAIWLL